MTQEMTQSSTPSGGLSQAMTAAEVVGQVKLIQSVMRDVMTDGEHYGVVPGSKKKSLWKSGAEKLCLVFRLAPRFKSTETYDGKHLTVKSECILIHSPSGREVGSGEAICTTKEKKYYWRKDGGKMVENQELPDLYNTVIKMANKRALVAATLVSTAASDIFTQDMGEDVYVVDDEPKKTEAVVKDTPKPEPKKEQNTWRGKVTAVKPEELPGGKPCWTVVGDDGKEFRTADQVFQDVLDGINPAGEYEIKYKSNAKGTLVIQEMRDAK